MVYWIVDVNVQIKIILFNTTNQQIKKAFHFTHIRYTSFFSKPLTLCISMIFLYFSQRHILCTVVCHHCQKRMKLSSILFSSQCGQASRFQTLLTKNYDIESYFIVTSTSGKGEGVFTCWYSIKLLAYLSVYIFGSACRAHNHVE